MKRLLPLLALLGAACAAPSTPEATSAPSTPAPTPTAEPLPALRTAPELTNEIWLNTDEPLRLADLRGQVVLLDMWTFGCYNCRNVIPHVQGWHEAYADDGLVVIGNHYPEFRYERSLDNLTEAVAELGITYPVAQDNDRATWGAYDNRYWPTLYLIDKWGTVRYVRIGEGAYAQIERNIQTLLAEPYPGDPPYESN